MHIQDREIAGTFELAGEAIRLWNRVGAAVVHEKQGDAWNQEQAFALAASLEHWFMAYKRQWRSIGREGDLHHIAEIVFWYVDCLRCKNK